MPIVESRETRHRTHEEEGTEDEHLPVDPIPAGWEEVDVMQLALSSSQ